MLVATSQKNKTPVTRLRVSYDPNKKQEISRIIYKDHFKYCRIAYSTDICVGARVANDGINYLHEIDLYNGSYSTIIDIIYNNNRSTGPNDREHELL